MAEAIQIVEAIRAVQEAKQRIPDYLRGKATFFSDWDLWQYHYVHDDRTCNVCLSHGDMSVIIGSKLRLLFPFLEIIDADMIYVFEHPNCRCWVERVS